MPLYEYLCEKDGTVIELIRPMSQADEPVTDPEGKGRKFVRRMSTFAAKGVGAGHVHSGPSCACGKPQGGCGG